MDYVKLASQLIRRLRGRRSQPTLSRRLGYRSNVIYNWESGQSFPSAAKFFSLLHQVGQSPENALSALLPDPSFAQRVDFRKKEGVAELLRELKGKRSIKDLSLAIGYDRFRVSRWLQGKSEPLLPDFLALLEVSTLSLIDFLSALVDPEELDESADHWRALQAARRSAKELPWSHAILRGVDLKAYRELSEHRSGWFASQLGLSVNDEQRCIDLLCATGDLVWDGTHYRSTEALMVDTGRDPDATRRLAAFWMQQGAERVSSAGEGNFAFNIFGISRNDLDALKELQRTYFAELRALVARSEPTERVVVATFQLYPLMGERYAEKNS